jgi:hypothetical protein
MSRATLEVGRESGVENTYYPEFRLFEWEYVRPARSDLSLGLVEFDLSRLR